MSLGSCRCRYSRHLLSELQNVRQRPHGRDAEWINLFVTLGIVLLDMLKLRGLAKGRHLPIQLPEPVMKGRIAASDVADVALEVLDVDRIEADNGRVEPDVGFGDVLAKVVWAGVLGEVGFCLVQMLEEGLDVLFVGFLRAVEEEIWHLAHYRNWP